MPPCHFEATSASGGNSTGGQKIGKRILREGHPFVDDRALVVALDRMGTPTIPGPTATFQEGDVAHIIVARDAIDGLRLKLEGQD